jgi:four helix bundle protein
MASVRRYEDLECYQLAVEIRRTVLRLTRREQVRQDVRFCAQIRDAARGAPRNISEGYSRFSPAEIAHFLSYAKASLAETKNHSVDGFESGHFTKEECEILLALVGRTIGAILRWMDYLHSPAARRFYEQHKARRRGEPVSLAPKRRSPKPRTREP